MLFRTPDKIPLSSAIPLHGYFGYPEDVAPQMLSKEKTTNLSRPSYSKFFYELLINFKAQQYLH